MKVTIFGGSGFVGSHVADALSEAGHDVTIFDLAPSSWLQANQNMVVGDILDPNAVSEAIRGADYVYNMAGIADIDEACMRPVATVSANILGNAHVLEACVQHKVQRFIYASTVYVYSQKGGFYRCSKQASEAYIEEYHRRMGLNFTILRYGTLYGPRSDSRNSIYRYLHQALTEGKLEVSGTGRERRDYIHVRDAARLSVEILDPQYANMHVTLTGHQSLYFQDILNMINEIMGNRLEIFCKGIPNDAHYAMTPYSYLPKTGLKLSSNLFTDLGQGLIEILEEIDAQRSAGE